MQVPSPVPSPVPALFPARRDVKTSCPSRMGLPPVTSPLAEDFTGVEFGVSAVRAGLYISLNQCSLSSGLVHCLAGASVSRQTNPKPCCPRPPEPPVQDDGPVALADTLFRHPPARGSPLPSAPLRGFPPYLREGGRGPVDRQSRLHGLPGFRHFAPDAPLLRSGWLLDLALCSGCSRCSLRFARVGGREVACSPLPFFCLRLYLVVLTRWLGVR